MLFFRNKSRYKQNISQMMGANLVGQGLTVLVAPFATRLFDPEHFGIVAIFSAGLVLLTAVGNLRFDWLIPNTTSHTQALANFSIGFIALCFFCLVIFFSAFFFDSEKIFAHEINALKPYLLLLSAALFGSGLQQLLQSWQIREGHLTTISKAKIFQSATLSLTTILFGVVKSGQFGLILSIILSQWLGLSFLLKNSIQLIVAKNRLSIFRIRCSFRKFWYQAIISTLGSLVNTVSLYAIPLLLARFYSVTEVGWYSLVHRVAITPTTILTGAIAQAFWVEASDLFTRHELKALRELYFRSAIRLLALAFPVIIIFLLAPFYIEFIFGEKWGEAGFILAALTPMIFGQIVISPFSQLLIVQGKQHWQATWDIARLICVLTTIYYTTTTKLDIASTTFWIAMTMMSFYLFLFALHSRLLNKQAKSP